MQLTIDFCVNRPILSAGMLARNGCKVTLNGTSTLKIGQYITPLVRRGSLFFLPVSRLGEPLTSLQTAALTAEIKATHRATVKDPRGSDLRRDGMTSSSSGDRKLV
jgi:hypothetical protein